LPLIPQLPGSFLERLFHVNSTGFRPADNPRRTAALPVRYAPAEPKLPGTLIL